jgi:hypothetical protein
MQLDCKTISEVQLCVRNNIKTIQLSNMDKHLRFQNVLVLCIGGETTISVLALSRSILVLVYTQYTQSRIPAKLQASWLISTTTESVILEWRATVFVSVRHPCLKRVLENHRFIGDCMRSIE